MKPAVEFCNLVADSFLRRSLVLEVSVNNKADNSLDIRVDQQYRIGMSVDPAGEIRVRMNITLPRIERPNKSIQGRRNEV